MPFSTRWAGTFLAASIAVTLAANGTAQAIAPMPLRPQAAGTHTTWKHGVPQSCSSRLFVPENANNDVQVYCIATQQIIATITGLNGPTGTVTDPSTNNLFVSETNNADIQVYNLPNLNNTGTVNGNYNTPRFLTDDPTSSTLYSADQQNFGSAEVSDARLLKFAGYVQGSLNGNTNVFGIAVDAASGLLFEDSYQGLTYEIGLAEPFRIAKTITGLDSCGLAVDRALSKLYVSECVSSGSGDVVIFNEKTLKLESRLEGLDQYVTGIAVDSATKQLYVAEYGSSGSGDVRVYNLNTGKLITTISPFMTPLGISIG